MKKRNLVCMVFKRVLPVLLILFAVSSVWAGGGQSGSSSTASSAGSGSLPLSTPRTLNVYMQPHPLVPLRNDALALQLIFEKTNIRVEIEADTTGSNERLNLLIATNQLPELAFIHPSFITNNYKSGVFLPVSKYIDQMPNFKHFWDTVPDLKTTMNEGELYGFHNLYTPMVPYGQGPVFRTDLLEKHNLPMPKTFSELLDLLETLNKIYPDSRPWTNRFGTPQLFTGGLAFSMGSGWGMYWDPDVGGGKWLYGQANPAFKEVLAFTADAYRRGILDPDFATNTADSWRDNIVGGRSFFWYDNAGTGVTFIPVLNQLEPDALLELIPYIEYSAGKKRAMPFYNPNVYTLSGTPKLLALRSDIRDLNTVIKFVDWLYSEEAQIITSWGKEGVSFRYTANGNKEFLPEFINPSLGTTDPYNDILSRGGLISNCFCMLSEHTTVQNTINKAIGNWGDVYERYWAINEASMKEGVFAMIHPNPPLNAQELERLMDLNQSVGTYLDQQYNRFILGQEPISNWDNVIRQARTLGAQEIEDIYNRAEARGW